MNNIGRLNNDFEEALKKIVGTKILQIQIHESGYRIAFDDDLVLLFGGDELVSLYKNDEKIGDNSLLEIPPIDDVILIE